MMHVDEFIDFGSNMGKSGDTEKYARYVLMHFRLNAVCKAAFRKYIEQMPLFCTWDNQRWRVIGASRMGDIWLTSDFNKEHGYDKRVAVDECSEWNKAP